MLLLALGALGATVLILVAPEVVFARGGGGSHTITPPTSVSSGGGIGGGGLFFLPFLFGGGGIFGLIMFVMFILPMLRGASGNMSQGGGGFPAPQMGAPYADPSAGLAAIKENDPGFSEQPFLDRARAAFFQLQKCWMDRNVDEGRAYMNAGLYQTWRMQVQQLVDAHKHNVLENLVIAGTSIVAAAHDANFDNITVKMDASAADYEVDDTSGKTVFGDKHDKPFTEYWTFTRSAGAKTLVSGGITESKCPNCGAPLAVTENGSCKYCNAPVTSGKFDWVLSKIDQVSEFQPY